MRVVELFRGPPGAGSFPTTDLAAFRKRLQAQGIVARVQMKSLCRPKSLAYGKIRVAQCDPEWRRHREFCRLAGVPWGNKGIGSCVLAAALNVLKPRRAAVPRAVERQAFAASRGRENYRTSLFAVCNSMSSLWSSTVI